MFERKFVRGKYHNNLWIHLIRKGVEQLSEARNFEQPSVFCQFILGEDRSRPFDLENIHKDDLPELRKILDVILLDEVQYRQGFQRMFIDEWPLEIGQDMNGVCWAKRKFYANTESE